MHHPKAKEAVISNAVLTKNGEEKTLNKSNTSAERWPLSSVCMSEPSTADSLYHQRLDFRFIVKQIALTSIEASFAIH